MNSQDLIQFELKPKEKPHLQNQAVVRGIVEGEPYTGDYSKVAFWIRCPVCAIPSSREQCEVIFGALECPHCHRLMSW